LNFFTGPLQQMLPVCEINPFPNYPHTSSVMQAIRMLNVEHTERWAITQANAAAQQVSAQYLHNHWQPIVPSLSAPHPNPAVVPNNPA
jgi:hypothetical protein